MYFYFEEEINDFVLTFEIKSIGLQAGSIWSLKITWVSITVFECFKNCSYGMVLYALVPLFHRVSECQRYVK